MRLLFPPLFMCVYICMCVEYSQASSSVLFMHNLEGNKRPLIEHQTAKVFILCLPKLNTGALVLTWSRSVNLKCLHLLKGMKILFQLGSMTNKNVQDDEKELVKF